MCEKPECHMVAHIWFHEFSKYLFNSNHKAGHLYNIMVSFLPNVTPLHIRMWSITLNVTPTKDEHPLRYVDPDEPTRANC